MNKTLRILTILSTVLYFFSSTALPALAAITYIYDPNGNMTSDGTECFEYNEANQLKKVKNCSNNQTIAEYVYDYNGTRVIKKIYQNGTLLKTVYSPSDDFETVKLASNGATQNTSYYMVNNEVVAKKNPDDSIHYYHNDHLGSTSVMTTQAGSLVEKTEYDPWGEVKSGGTKSKFLYTGQENDSETKLHYYNARYYDPHIRRFTQPDDIIQNVYNPQDLNRYSYVRNNPIRYTDPSGHIAWVPIIIIGAGAAYGGTEAIASYELENPSASWQQKLGVGAIGAATGALTTTAALYGSSTIVASAVVGGTLSGAQQMFTNAVSGKPVFQTNVFTQAAIGTLASGVTAKAAKAMNLIPNNVGRPIKINNDRKLADSITKNSANAINKNTVPAFIENKLKVIGNSLLAIFSSNTNKKHTKRR
jgi:RHS repeat-associated protein